MKHRKVAMYSTERGKNFMMDMSRGGGKHKDKKKEYNKKQCRTKINTWNY